MIEDQPKIESESITTSGGPEESVRGGSARYVAMFLGSVVVALIVVVGALVLNPPKDEVPLGQDLSASATGESDSGQPSTVAPAKVPKSSVRLPEVAVAATAEELQSEAEKVAESLRQAYPQRPEALHVAAMLAAQIRRSEDAEKLWTRCIELDPKQVAYYVNLGAIAMERGDSQLAADTLQKAIDAGCASVDVYHHLAVALTQLGQSDEAEAVIQKTLAQHPQSGAYLLVLGQAQLKAGKVAEAEANLRKAIELGSATASAYFALANACARQNKAEDAAKFRELFAKLKTETPLDKQRRFQILSTAESRRTAVTILCEAAAVERQQKNALESERLLLRAVALDPASPVPCRLLAELYQGSGMLAEAKTVWTRLTEIEPYQGVNYLMLAQCCAQLGEPESAEAALKLSVTMRPDAVDGYAMLAQLYRERADAGKARWFAQEALRREPSAEGYEFLAELCRMTGDQAAAEAAHASAVNLSSKRPTSQEGVSAQP